MLWKSFVRLADGAVVGPARRYEGDRLEVKLAPNTWMFGLADHFWLASNSRGGTNAFQAAPQFHYDVGMHTRQRGSFGSSQRAASEF
jgi:hypothetical protein